jgi:hypothetical protein
MGKRRLSVRTPERGFLSSSKRARRLLTPTLVVVDGSGTNTPTARDAVLNTTELLERIIAHLPNRKIFTIQRVSRHWREVIAACPNIQEMLFFRPTPSGKPFQIWELVDAKTNRVRILPEVPVRLKAHTSDNPPDEHTQEGTGGDSTWRFLPVALNPLMERAVQSILSRGCLKGLDEPAIASTITETRHERVTYKGSLTFLERYASMYLTNPPTCNAYIDVTVFYRDANGSCTTRPVKATMCRIVVASRAGLKINDIIEGTCRGESVSCFLHAHDNVSLLDGSTLGRLRNTIREKCKWRRAIRDPIIHLDIILQASALHGLLPIVPTAKERCGISRN